MEELNPSQHHVVWDYEPSQIRHLINAIDPGLAADWIGPKVGGGVRWMFVPMPPSSQGTHRSLPGIDEHGFHTTKTIDFDVILDGELTMILDDDRVRLEKGDFVIQQATRHAWRNETERTAILLALIHRPEGV
jgi:hypothetical protein